MLVYQSFSYSYVCLPEGISHEISHYQPLVIQLPSLSPIKSSIPINQGLVNVLIEHHPNIGDIISNRYLKGMFQIPKLGHLPSPDNSL